MPRSITARDAVSRLETIQTQINELLEHLRPLLYRLHHAEDAPLESVFGEQLGSAEELESAADNRG
jgi:hypothetical protein